MARNSHAASNGLGISPPPPYPHQYSTDNNTTPSASSGKRWYSFKGRETPSSREELGRASGVNEGTPSAATIFSSHDIEHYLDLEYRRLGRTLSSAGGTLGEVDACGLDQDSASGRSTLPPPYSPLRLPSLDVVRTFS